MQSTVSLRPEGEANDDAIAVSCSRAPEGDFKPFKMRWVDVENPAAGTSSVSKGLAASWGLKAEIVSPAQYDSATDGTQLLHEKQAIEIAQSIVAYVREKPGQSFSSIVTGVRGGAKQKKGQVFEQLVTDRVLEVLTKKLHKGVEVTTFTVADRDLNLRAFLKWKL